MVPQNPKVSAGFRVFVPRGNLVPTTFPNRGISRIIIRVIIPYLNLLYIYP
jgi:hypothetical protein